MNILSRIFGRSPSGVYSTRCGTTETSANVTPKWMGVEVSLRCSGCQRARWEKYQKDFCGKCQVSGMSTAVQAGSRRSVRFAWNCGHSETYEVLPEDLR